MICINITFTVFALLVLLHSFDFHYTNRQHCCNLVTVTSDYTSSLKFWCILVFGIGFFLFEIRKSQIESTLKEKQSKRRTANKQIFCHISKKKQKKNGGREKSSELKYTYSINSTQICHMWIVATKLSLILLSKNEERLFPKMKIPQRNRHIK